MKFYFLSDLELSNFFIRAWTDEHNFKLFQIKNQYNNNAMLINLGTSLQYRTLYTLNNEYSAS